MPENFVQVPPNSSGLKIETAELLRPDGTTVERQIIVVGDPNNQNLWMQLDAGGRLLLGQDDVLTMILIELRVTNLILAQTLGFTDDLDNLRNDRSLAPNL